MPRYNIWKVLLASGWETVQGASLKISTYLELSLQATSLTAAAAAAAEPPAPAAMIYLYALKYFTLDCKENI